MKIKQFLDNINEDEKLANYQRQESELAKKKTQRRIQLAKHSDIIVESIDDLAREWSVDKEAINTEELCFSSFPRNILQSYYPQEEGRFGKTKAYDCPQCGIVLGEPHKEQYNDLGILSGSKGMKYNCYVCEQELGREIHVIS